MMVTIRNAWRPGQAKVALWAPQEPPNTYMRHAGLMVRRDESSLRRQRGRVQWLPPVPLFGPPPGLGYNIYSNAGSGPINYSSAIATAFTTTWTSGPLAFPDTWMFGVRAFDANGEEQNLDAAVTLILDGSGIDITNRPKPPFGLRAFPLANGAIRAEWSYNTINPQPVPTGFHVYLGDTVTGVLRPTSPVHAGRRGKWMPGSVTWKPAIGSGIDYAHPVATISYQSAIAGSFVANIPGLLNGVTYRVAIRAYNGVAEDPNTSFVTVTADSVGPTAVVNLTAVATA